MTIMETLVEVKKKKLHIKEIRKRLGMTQEEFGAIFGVSRQAVSNWEKSLYVPSFLEDGLKFYLLLKEINCSYEDVAIPNGKE